MKLMHVSDESDIRKINVYKSDARLYMNDA